MLYSQYEKEINYYVNNGIYLDKSFHNMDLLLSNVFNYINEKISKLDLDSKKELLMHINNIILDNSLEIIKRNELRRNKKFIDIRSKMIDKSTYEIFNMLDTTKLKNMNYVYSNFQSILNDKSIKK